MSIPNITADRKLYRWRGLILTGVLIAGVSCFSGCNRGREEAGNGVPAPQPVPVKDWGGRGAPASQSVPITDWDGRKVVPVQAPADWSVWTAGDRVRVATPVPLQLREDNDPIPGFDIKIYQANHDGVRYQVSVSAEPRRTSADRIETYFDGMLTNFAAPGQFRPNGPAERLSVEGYPGVQAQFADGTLQRGRSCGALRRTGGRSLHPQDGTGRGERTGRRELPQFTPDQPVTVGRITPRPANPGSCCAGRAAGSRPPRESVRTDSG